MSHVLHNYNLISRFVSYAVMTNTRTDNRVSMKNLTIQNENKKTSVFKRECVGRKGDV